MKPIEELHVAVIDAGTFVALADMFGRRAKRTSYYSPFEQEFLEIERCCIGDGMENFDRVDDFMEPEFFDSVDLWVFPDIGYGGFQRYLRSLKKWVWGSAGASDLELYRTLFLKTIHGLDLPMVDFKVCRGLTELSNYLYQTTDKWVKINRYRGNMETWHHVNWNYSQRKLEELAKTFGPLKESVVFVVQDTIKDEEVEPVLEVGYDGWAVTMSDGETYFPDSSYQGYELKNELYLGSLRKYDDLPEQVVAVNEEFSKALAPYGYRNFLATEIRIKGGQGYFIDPTTRMAGQTQEHLLRTCRNLPEIMWAGAQGEVVQPEFSNPFAAEATMHYTNDSDGWKTLSVPDEIADSVKLYRCCRTDEGYQFPPHKCDELGVICGEGDSVEEAIANLKHNFDQFEDAPVCIDVAGFAELLEQIETAEGEGVKFSNQPVPDPAIALQ